ncbi:MAG TPA: hypothetical protein VFA66_11780 [Gaiellaceae bacterium]|nr:hypothetical protein [Gaiellaceae bacterium]
MREEGVSWVTHAVVASATVDASAVRELDRVAEGRGREIVLDLSSTIRVDDEAVALLDRLAQELENAGGRLTLTARWSPEGIRTTRSLRAGDPASALGVHPALDVAVLNQLTAGGVASW